MFSLFQPTNDFFNVPRFLLAGNQNRIIGDNDDGILDA